MTALDKVQVYYFTLKTLQDGAYHRFTSQEEKMRALKFRSEEDRLMFLLSRGFLRSLLAGNLGCDCAEVHLRHSPNGKPVLYGTGKRIHFNMSHSGTSGLCAISFEKEVGVDLEAVRPYLPEILEGLIDDCFTSQEKKIWESLLPKKRPDLFFKFWVRKEAATKAMGNGLTFPLNHLDVSGITERPIRIRGVEQEEICLAIRDIDVPAPYVAALCLKNGYTLNEPQVLCLETEKRILKI